MSSSNPESLLEQVGQSSSAILDGTQEGWEEFCINGEPRDEVGELERLSLTSLYRIPGVPSPKLHKAAFRNENFPLEAITDLENALARRFVEEWGSAGQAGYTVVAQAISSALEEIKNGISEDSEFNLVAMLGIFNTLENTVYAYTFAPTDFLDAIEKQLPDHPSDGEISETVLRDMYAAESEQSDNIEPYEEWKQLVLNALAVPKEEIPEHSRAETQLHPLLLPSEHTHPTISGALFI